ncbi:anthranilate synthase component I family protein [Roseiconus lacunae]|uniref:Anthranilate synthase component I family protein n=1 Tax=Roseiconus lacunae TaxID=2605694 RepID=A0ABT7PI87_9BACT|nr:anthranilate synthase component I family protein [Roseiconus lacunae]MDM4016009.1 anthranilate synthase component I family protein [Roseiconus lacunae]
MDLHDAQSIPLVVPLRATLDPEDIFCRLEPLGRRVWLDSVHREENASPSVEDAGALQSPADPHGRYSFLTADPIVRLSAKPSDPDPWPELARLAKLLPASKVQSLPPFQGGLVGILGYESARWLEPIELATCHRQQIDDLPTPAMSFGVFDWAIAIDHDLERQWLICQGWDRDQFDRTHAGSSEATVGRKVELANKRASQVLALLDEPSPGLTEPSSAEVPGRRLPDGESHCEIRSNFAEGEFRSAVSSIVKGIGRGDTFQVNLAQRLTAEQPCAADELYLALRAANPAPQSGFYDGGTFQVLSSSPEGFLQIRERRVVTRPIKGTRRRTGDRKLDQALAEEMLASEKERAENIMIVDLMRNDLSRVCTDHSVTVSKLCELESYEFVQHLVSVVEAELSQGVSIVDCLRACFPGGSVTGAPKIEAMKTIARLEPNPRGPYCGSMGYISCSGDADFNILIRTMTATDEVLQIPVGGGITARSHPADEESETWTKAQGMLRAIGANWSSGSARLVLSPKG